MLGLHEGGLHGLGQWILLTIPLLAAGLDRVEPYRVQLGTLLVVAGATALGGWTALCSTLCLGIDARPPAIWASGKRSCNSLQLLPVKHFACTSMEQR